MKNLVSIRIIEQKYFDVTKIICGTKVHAKQVLSCDILPNGKRKNIRYDIDDDAIIADVFEDLLILEFEYSHRQVEINIEDVNEWEIEIK
jgi:hypothetical protein